MFASYANGPAWLSLALLGLTILSWSVEIAIISKHAFEEHIAF
jgi:hypothetical protein